jgi:hypothetical protein
MRQKNRGTKKPGGDALAHIFHIEREQRGGDPRPITLPEWTEAVERTDGLRMAHGDASAINPLTEDVIVIPNRGGDVELFRDDCQQWMRALWWTPEGTVRFAAPATSEDPVVRTAKLLAQQLEAKVVDDDGRVYN